MEAEYRVGVQSLSENGSLETNLSEEEMSITKGPWTEEEDSLLFNYITLHGEGHWNSVARSTGLRRTGKSCRLRWLNYLRPNVRRGNITLQEQLLILDLHSRLGNRWSKIAQHLPGRTDNEIKNYWRTRVVKQAKQLKCDVNSKQFRDTLRFVWMPRMLERIQAQASSARAPPTQAHSEPSASYLCSKASSAVVGVHAPSLSDSGASYNNNNLITGGGEEGSTPWQQRNYFDVSGNIGFGGVDWWTDENICFLQQQLADDL